MNSLPSTALLSTKDKIKMAAIYGGMPLLVALPGTPAEKAGMISGDIVVEVNGEPTPDHEAFISARNKVKGSCSVKFIRDGEEHNVELVFNDPEST